MHEHVWSGNEIDIKEWLNSAHAHTITTKVSGTRFCPLIFPSPEVLAVCELLLLLLLRKPFTAAIRTESWSPAVSSLGDRSRVFKRGSAQI